MPDAGSDAPSHFRGLEAAEGCWQFTYRNLEAVPTEGGPCGDYFARVSTFKQHESALPRDATLARGSAAHTALQRWHARSSSRLGRPAWFMFYTNGKSAVRVDPVGWRHLVCVGVHGWAVRASVRECYPACTAMGHPKGWHTNICKDWQGSRTINASEGAVVLHYACCTGSGFAAKDWRALGYLGVPWAPGVGVHPSAARWHQMQTERGKPKAGAGAAGGALATEHESLFGLSDESELRRQVEAGVLVRVKRACDLLGK